MQAPIKAINYHNSSHTRIELQAAAARGLDCCWAAGSERGALCKNREMYVYPLRAEKPGLHPNITCVHGDRGRRNPIPGDVAETRGFDSSVPKAKKVLKACHATHCTDRDQTSGIVTSTVEFAHPIRRFGQRCEHEEKCPNKKRMTIVRTSIHICNDEW